MGERAGNVLGSHGQGGDGWMKVEAGLRGGGGRTQSRTIREGSARAASNSALLVREQHVSFQVESRMGEEWFKGSCL